MVPYLTVLRNKTIRFKSKKEPLNKRISLKQGYPGLSLQVSLTELKKKCFIHKKAANTRDGVLSYRVCEIRPYCLKVKKSL